MNMIESAAAGTGQSDLAQHEKDTRNPPDRRSTRREPAYDISEICFAGGRAPVTCLVHNVSGVGARIETATAELPPRFILANHGRRLRAVCQVVWRDGTLFGVRFLTPPRQMA
ncbi:MAG: PilZ domain-containing protein [Pseudomonadota bacterium]|nr:PilZ domain-containing protein [Pseudomonadota bacterium]